MTPLNQICPSRAGQRQLQWLANAYGEEMDWILLDKRSFRVPFENLRNRKKGQELALPAASSFAAWLNDRRITSRVMEVCAAELYGGKQAEHAVVIIEDLWIADWAATQVGQQGFPLIQTIHQLTQQKTELEKRVTAQAQASAKAEQPPVLQPAVA